MRSTLSFAILISVSTLLSASCSSATSAASLASEDATKSLCAFAATSFGKGQIDEAFSGLKHRWPLVPAEIDALAIQSKSQFGLVGSRYGEFVDVAFVRTERVGEIAHRHTFAIMYTNHPLRFSCSFYKPRDNWQVNGVNWDDKPLVPVSN